METTTRPTKNLRDPYMTPAHCNLFSGGFHFFSVLNKPAMLQMGRQHGDLFFGARKTQGTGWPSAEGRQGPIADRMRDSGHRNGAKGPSCTAPDISGGEGRSLASASLKCSQLDLKMGVHKKYGLSDSGRPWSTKSRSYVGGRAHMVASTGFRTSPPFD